MKHVFDLPTSVEFGGRRWEINTDFRDVLLILEAFEDPDLTEWEKALICIRNLYKSRDIPPEQTQAAFDAALEFIDHFSAKDDGHSPRTMDWTQDGPLIFPAVNRVAGFETRSAEYIHWWTFMGWFMEIRDSTYATVLGLRNKKTRGKKLEKHEQEFWRENKGICELKTRYTEEELAEQERLRSIIGG